MSWPLKAAIIYLCVMGILLILLALSKRDDDDEDE